MRDADLLIAAWLTDNEPVVSKAREGALALLAVGVTRSLPQEVSHT